ncbi:hypothetical protein MUK42_20541 [Musa troglodytarum]|uniref:Uncharacterized protein n=1 Tax=Musa troglodytarum TaxID=320322 RepID=A0A9E7FWL2_9LILI|nr:hypothetical protein MUK42_20541 [Musa troglodytarum]
MEEQSVRARWPWSINLGNIRMKSLLHLGIIQQWISYRYARLRRTVGANANGSIDIDRRVLANVSSDISA